MNPVERLNHILLLNRNRQKRFREKHSEQIKRSRFRVNNNQIVNNDPENEENDQEEIKESNYLLTDFEVVTYEDMVNSINAYPFTDSTRESYLSHLSTLARILHYDDYLQGFLNYRNSIELLSNHKGADNSKKAYVQILIIVIDKFKMNIPKNVLSKYVDYLNSLKGANNVRIDLLKQTEEVIRFSTYVQMVKDHYGKESKEFLVISMYDELTVRDDLKSLVVCNDMSQVNYDHPKDNYLYLPTRRKTKSLLILLHAKTLKNEIYEAEYSAKVSDIIRDYLQQFEFQFGKHGLFGKTSLSGYISKMNKELGVKGAIGKLRRMKVSEQVNVLKISEIEKVALSKKMMHSITTQSAVYNRRNIR